jgi:hypothetical protein
MAPALPARRLPPQAHMLAMPELSLQAIANQLNAEGIPTLSGRGTWKKGTIGNLLAQGEESQTR